MQNEQSKRIRTHRGPVIGGHVECLCCIRSWRFIVYSRLSLGAHLQAHQRSLLAYLDTDNGVKPVQKKPTAFKLQVSTWTTSKELPLVKNIFKMIKK